MVWLFGREILGILDSLSRLNRRFATESQRVGHRTGQQANNCRNDNDSTYRTLLIALA